MKLKNKVAIITGGAGGIGKTIAKSFIKEGAKVIIAEINKKELKNTINELKKIGNNTICGLITDITKPNQVKKLVKKTETIYGAVDILVNTAGIQKPIGPLTEINENDWIKNINTNLIGTMLCCKYVLPFMISKRKGKIINFSGGGATFPRPYFSAYASSKAGIVRFTETIAMEVRKVGVDINAIAPGGIYTKMLEEIINAGKKAGNELNDAIKIKKMKASPELAVELCVFLASEDSNGITGKLISAVWDDWKNLKNNLGKTINSSLFTLRRVDGTKIVEIKK
jgi:NAD(P)-dependent dehydrogenase (short-subunit alcohol dehydrogenase family)